MTIYRSWDKRRIVFTKKIIVFANVNDDGVLDIVPLHEVKNIRDTTLQDEIITDNDSELKGSIDSDDHVTGKKYTFEIETIPEGYNSGRVYRIQAESARDFRTILDNLPKLANVAREEAEAKSRFNKSQQRVGKVFNSNIIQRALAILVFGVRNTILFYAIGVNHAGHFRRRTSL
jgi:hypothetical protein